MKRSEVVAQQLPQLEPIQRDMHFVHRDGPSVKVHRYVIEDASGVGRRPRYVAELSAHEGVIERAVIEAASNDELARLIETAARAFSMSIRQRSRCTRVRP